MPKAIKIEYNQKDIIEARKTNYNTAVNFASLKFNNQRQSIIQTSKQGVAHSERRVIATALIQLIQANSSLTNNTNLKEIISNDQYSEEEKVDIISKNDDFLKEFKTIERPPVTIYSERAPCDKATQDKQPVTCCEELLEHCLKESDKLFYSIEYTLNESKQAYSDLSGEIEVVKADKDFNDTKHIKANILNTQIKIKGGGKNYLENKHLLNQAQRLTNHSQFLKDQRKDPNKAELKAIQSLFNLFSINTEFLSYVDKEKNIKIHQDLLEKNLDIIANIDTKEEDNNSRYLKKILSNQPDKSSQLAHLLYERGMSKIHVEEKLKFYKAALRYLPAEHALAQTIVTSIEAIEEAIEFLTLDNWDEDEIGNNSQISSTDNSDIIFKQQSIEISEDKVEKTPILESELKPELSSNISSPDPQNIISDNENLQSSPENDSPVEERKFKDEMDSNVIDNEATILSINESAQQVPFNELDNESISPSITPELKLNSQNTSSDDTPQEIEDDSSTSESDSSENSDYSFVNPLSDDEEEVNIIERGKEERIKDEKFLNEAYYNKKHTSNLPPQRESKPVVRYGDENQTLKYKKKLKDITEDQATTAKKQDQSDSKPPFGLN